MIIKEDYQKDFSLLIYSRKISCFESRNFRVKQGTFNWIFTWQRYSSRTAGVPLRSWENRLEEESLFKMEEKEEEESK